MRGKAAIVGYGETPHRRSWPGRTERGLCAEAAAEAIRDAGLRKEDIDGLLTYGGAMAPAVLAEYMGIRPVHFATGVSMWGSSAAVALTVAAAAINAGLCNYALFVGGGARDPAYAPGGIFMEGAAAAGPVSTASEFETIFGPAIAANNSYGYLYARHMYEYGTKPEQLAKIAVNQRFNALTDPLSAFQGQPITVEDVLNSRYTNWPLHLLECVMPTAGAVAYIVTSADLAKGRPHPPVYILGAGVSQGVTPLWRNPRICDSPVIYSAKSAYAMAGYSASDIQFAEFYD